MLRKIVVTSFAVAALALTASAQGRGGSRSSGMGDNMPMGGGQARMNRLDLLERVLNLNKDQRKDVKNIMDAGEKEAAPLREEMEKARQSVASAVESGKQDQVDQAVKSYADVETKMSAIELKSFAEMFKLLDGDQKTKTRAVFMMMSGIFNTKNWMEVQQQ